MHVAIVLESQEPIAEIGDHFTRNALDFETRMMDMK